MANGTGTRRLIAVILGVLGVVILLDVLVIALVHENIDYHGFRQALVLIIAALLVIAGVVTFAWPKKGNVETTEDT